MATHTESAATHFRIITPHTSSADYHHWVFLPGWQAEPVAVRRDSWGRRNGRGNRSAWRTWVVLICNNTECAGRAIVPAALLEDVANAEDPVVNR